MPVIPGAARFDAVVDPTRIKGDHREFVNVIPATTSGMKYNPADYDLLTVHEPGVGYRNIALDAVVETSPPGHLDKDLGWDTDELEAFINKRKKFHDPSVKRKKQ